MTRPGFILSELHGQYPQEGEARSERVLTGFTLLELLLVVAMTAAMAVAGYVAVQQSVVEDARDTAARVTIQGLRRAQRSAVYFRGDDPWGVVVSSQSVTVFRGDDVVNRDPVFDEVLSFPSPVQVSGTTVYVFAKGSGYPDRIGTMSFSFDTEPRLVRINAFGTAIYVP